MAKRWKHAPPNSNWGAFGEDDQLGRMNWVNAEKVRQGAAEIQAGVCFSLSLPLDFPGGRVDRTISITFIIGSALASVAGMMFVLYYGVIDFRIGFLAGLKAFTAAVLGGIGSLPGAMLGGLIIGLIETMWSGYVSVEYKDVAAFSILVIVLIFFPTGFLGKPDIEKV